MRREEVRKLYDRSWRSLYVKRVSLPRPLLSTSHEGVTEDYARA